ncbi:MAG TPA: aryl-sulfate sulfotransferase [Acidobacteriaceae bacterium]|nr:aryl-sulfate sulfotransferase [Acidobacteriaceae bacterium]
MIQKWDLPWVGGVNNLVLRCGLAILACLLPLGCGYHINQATSATQQQQPAPAQPPQTASQSGTVTISPQYVALAPGGTEHFQATAQGGGSLTWLVNGVRGGSASAGTVDSKGNYTAPAHLQLSTNVAVTAILTSAPQANYATAIASVINPGVVTSTANPQVAIYSIYLPAPGKASVAFGANTQYGLNTWEQPTPSPNGGQISIFVAGMLAESFYHMHAQVTLNDGATFSDTDQVFATGVAPVTAPITATTTSGQVPQSGIELFDTAIPREPGPAFATDLQGNVIWTYSYSDGSKADIVQPIKLLPNGHFLVQIAYGSSIAVKSTTIPPGSIDLVREVDLAGNTIRELTQSQLASALTARGYNLQLGSFHHDVLALPNGHWVILATVIKAFNNLPGYPGTTNVLGDILIDVDQNNQPDWVWNGFDHLDVNRHPYLFPDWTHSNSMLYSRDDHDIILSMRHQNWILKIDFADGQGSGRILWRLGEGGDFKLVGGTDPTDWFYAQHGLAFFSPNTSGVFRLGAMDNGDDRVFPNGMLCGTTGAPACYSAAPVLQLDETAMTATLISDYKAPATAYSFFGGDVQLLDNGDLGADFCAAGGGSLIEELNMSTSSPQVVWQARSWGTAQYRAERLSSLYPGVQW